MEAILDALARASWQGGIAIIAVWGISRLFPRLPAAIRCTLWRLTYVKLLLSLVVAGAVLLPVLPPAPAVVSSRSHEVSPTTNLPPATAPTTVSSAGEAPAVPSPTRPPVSGSTILLLLYGAGITLSVASLFGAWRRTRTIIHGATPASPGILPALCAELAERLKLRRLPGLWTTEKVTSPLLVGVVRESVLLPEPWAATAPASEIRLALAHELAHVRRRDLAWEWLGAVVQILFFFHPLVWLARREERAAREMACDTIALSLTGEPASVYSRLLYQIAALPAGHRTISVGALGSGEKGRLLLMRITQLGGTVPSQRYVWFGIVAATMLLLVTAVPWRLTVRLSVGSPLVGKRLSGVVRTPEGVSVRGASVFWLSTIPLSENADGYDPHLRSKVYAMTTTDSLGRYYFDRRSDGPGIIMAHAEGWGLSFSEPLSSNPGDTSIVLQPAILQEIVCKDERGNLLAQIPIHARKLVFPNEVVYLDDLALPGFRKLTDGYGRYRLAGVLSKATAGLIPASRDWFLLAERKRTTPEGYHSDFILGRAGKIRGTVQSVDRQGKRLGAARNVIIRCQGIDDKTRHHGTHVSADGSGSYEIWGLRPGKYRVWPSKRMVRK